MGSAKITSISDKGDKVEVKGETRHGKKIYFFLEKTYKDNKAVFEKVRIDFYPECLTGNGNTIFSSSVKLLTDLEQMGEDFTFLYEKATKIFQEFVKENSL